MVGPRKQTFERAGGRAGSRLQINEAKRVTSGETQDFVTRARSAPIEKELRKGGPLGARGATRPVYAGAQPQRAAAAAKAKPTCAHQAA